VNLRCRPLGVDSTVGLESGDLMDEDALRGFADARREIGVGEKSRVVLRFVGSISFSYSV
jgi:hypothetical protein